MRRLGELVNRYAALGGAKDAARTAEPLDS